MESGRRLTWNNLLQALRVEPREGNTVTGMSGIEHQVLAVGVDDKTGRVILVSAEHDARTSAILQADVQACLTDAKVLVIRPVAIDLNVIAQVLLAKFGTTTLNLVSSLDDKNQAEIQNYLTETLDPLLAPFKLAFKTAPIHIVAQIMNVVQQLSSFDFSRIAEGSISFTEFLNIDFREPDRRFGVCHLPLYELTEEDWELVESGRDIDALKHRLKQLGIHQYFFPPLDQTAIGLVDRGITDPSKLREGLSLPPVLGHPFGNSEIIDPGIAIADVIDELQSRNLIVEGEIGVELSGEGREIRHVVKYRPREGVLSKVVNRLNLQINLSTENWFGVSKK